MSVLDKVSALTGSGYERDLDGLESALSDLWDEYELLIEECESRINEVMDEVEEYYKPRSNAELYGVSDKDFY